MNNFNNYYIQVNPPGFGCSYSVHLDVKPKPKGIIDKIIKIITDFFGPIRYYGADMHKIVPDAGQVYTKFNGQSCRKISSIVEGVTDLVQRDEILAFACDNLSKHHKATYVIYKRNESGVELQLK